MTDTLPGWKSGVEQALAQSRGLRADLGASVAALARDISVPPSRRDGGAIRALWADIDAQRPRCNKLRRILQRQKPRPGHQLDREGQTLQRRLKSELALLKREIGFWPSMDCLVQRHIDPAPTGLLVDRPARDGDEILSLVYAALHALFNPHPQTEEAEENGCFADIPLSVQGFEALMVAAYRLRLILDGTDRTRFLDVGCGGGTKVLAATRLFPVCHGLEYDPAYARAAKRSFRVLKTEGVEIHEGNGLTWDRYDQYDVIYLYRPIRDDGLLKQLEDRIAEQARPGTIICAPYDTALSPREGIALTPLARCIFVTGMSQKDADALIREAERTSTEKIRRSASFGYDTGIWAPLLDAATFNGTR